MIIECPRCGKLNNTKRRRICRKCYASLASSDCSDECRIEFESREAMLDALCHKVFGAKPTYRNRGDNQPQD